MARPHRSHTHYAALAVLSGLHVRSVRTFALYLHTLDFTVSAHRALQQIHSDIIPVSQPIVLQG